MSDAPHSVYVYYRVALGQAPAAQAGVHRLFQSLKASCPGLQTRLMRKVHGPQAESDATWMEVYTHPQGVDAELLARMADEAHALLAHQTGPRHVEVFTPMPGFETGGLDDAMRY
jgi:Domain of unknown function (DUF4936)